MAAHLELCSGCAIPEPAGTFTSHMQLRRHHREELGTKEPISIILDCLKHIHHYSATLQWQKHELMTTS